MAPGAAVPESATLAIFGAGRTDRATFDLADLAP
jgi:hypothetical protein